MIVGIDHVDINVPDIPAAMNFYCEGLGLRRVKDGNPSGIIKTPDGVIFEISGNGVKDYDKGGITHICLNTYDVDKTFKRALECGATISRESDPEPVTYKDLRMAFVRTPSGEELEFWGIRNPDGSFGESAPEGKYIKNFVHVALTVPDLKKTIAFYEAIGAKLKEDWEWGASMTLLDGRELELFSGGEYAENPKAYRHVSLICDNVDETAKQILAAGGKMQHEPYDWSNVRISFLRGLYGEVIELFYFYDDEDREIDVFTGPPDKLPNLFEEKR